MAGGRRRMSKPRLKAVAAVLQRLLNSRPPSENPKGAELHKEQAMDATPTPPPLPLVPGQTRWYYADANNQPQGPFPFDELKRLFASGAITPETYVIEVNGSKWKQFSDVSSKADEPPPVLPVNEKLPNGPRRVELEQQLYKAPPQSLNANNNAGGCCGIVAGVLLCCTGVGAVIGVPLIIWILICMGKAQRAGATALPLGKKLNGKAPRKQISNRLAAMIIIGCCFVIIGGLVIAAKYDMISVGSAPTQTFSALPPDRVREMMAEVFGDKLKDVSVTEAVSDDNGNLIEGQKTFCVLVTFDAAELWSDESMGQDIESKMAKAYKALYTSNIDIIEACMIAHAQLRDKYGNTNDGVVYKTILDQKTARKINWENADDLDFSRIWHTERKHRGFK